MYVGADDRQNVAIGTQSPYLGCRVAGQRAQCTYGFVLQSTSRLAAPRFPSPQSALTCAFSYYSMDPLTIDIVDAVISAHEKQAAVRTACLVYDQAMLEYIPWRVDPFYVMLTCFLFVVYGRITISTPIQHPGPKDSLPGWSS